MKPNTTVWINAELSLGLIDRVRRVSALRHAVPDCGAMVTFDGMVRPSSKEGESVEALILDHHPEMTAPSIERIAHDGAARFDVQGISVAHRSGRLLPGDMIVFVAVASAHRRAAFECADYLMDRLKTDAVFWKREQGKFGERWIEPTSADTKDRERWYEETAGH